MFDLTKLNIFYLDSTQIGDRRIRAQWTTEMAQDVAAFHGIDAEAELTAILHQQIRDELNRQMLNHITEMPSPQYLGLPGPQGVQGPLGSPGPQGIAPPMGLVYYTDYVPRVPLQFTPPNVNSEAALINVLHTNSFFNTRKLKPFKLIDQKSLMARTREEIIELWETFGLT